MGCRAEKKTFKDNNKMKKIIVLSILLISSMFAFAQSESNEGIAKEKEFTAKGSVEYYGDKAGFLRPCKGTCYRLCKKITHPELPTSSTKSGTAENKKVEYVRISDGNRSIIVEKSRVNFSDGSIK